jgi:hypothetical protein
MPTNTRTAIALLNEAAAIMEAEWMRLEQDLWCEIGELFAELPAPRTEQGGAYVATALQRRASLSLSSVLRRPRPFWPAVKVWATQRSPPRGSRVVQISCRTGEVRPRR